MHGYKAFSSHRGRLKRPCTYLNGPPMHTKLHMEASTWHLIKDETHNFDSEKVYDFPDGLRGMKMWPNPHPVMADGSSMYSLPKSVWSRRMLHGGVM